jgi:hypothetical protein
MVFDFEDKKVEQNCDILIRVIIKAEEIRVK